MAKGQKPPKNSKFCCKCKENFPSKEEYAKHKCFKNLAPKTVTKKPSSTPTTKKSIPEIHIITKKSNTVIPIRTPSLEEIYKSKNQKNPIRTPTLDEIYKSNLKNSIRTPTLEEIYKSKNPKNPANPIRAKKSNPSNSKPNSRPSRYVFT